ncbi:MAG: triose-phosphate isomerase [Vampirovibrionales bacterium]
MIAKGLTPLVAGNWKMYKTPQEAQAFVAQYKACVAGEALASVETLVCPTVLALASAMTEAQGSALQIGAQNAWHVAEGAYTGEVSAQMFQQQGVKYIIVGHSERRQYFGETDALVAEKTVAIQALGMVPIVCVGETLQEREAGQTDAVITQQLQAVLAKTNPATTLMVIAYEPVWAIGTGKVCESAEAQRVCAMIRTLLGEGGRVTRVLYGGSVKPDNALELFSQADIDGGLVGGASLQAESYATLVRHAAHALQAPVTV